MHSYCCKYTQPYPIHLINVIAIKNHWVRFVGRLSPPTKNTKCCWCSATYVYIVGYIGRETTCKGNEDKWKMKHPSNIVRPGLEPKYYWSVAKCATSKATDAPWGNWTVTYSVSYILYIKVGDFNATKYNLLSSKERQFSQEIYCLHVLVDSLWLVQDQESTSIQCIELSVQTRVDARLLYL